MVATQNDHSLFHEKFGIFFSGDESVAFSGSVNETYSGWAQSGNREGLETNRSWNEAEFATVLEDINEFENLWLGRDPEVSVREPCQNLIKIVENSANRGEEVYKELLSKPSARDRARFSLRKTPGPHQAEVLQSWEASNFRGIIKFCTGAGKTVAAMWAMKQMFDLGKGVLVLLPSKLLLEQWSKELRDFFPDISLLLVGGGNSAWKNSRLLEATLKNSSDLGTPKAVLAITATARKEEFLSRIKNKDWCLVVDEAHHIGAPGIPQNIKHHTRLLPRIVSNSRSLWGSNRNIGDLSTPRGHT